jgi:mRNA interferase HigB
LARFLKIAHNAEWPHSSALKETFSTADTGKRTGKVIFDIGGNKYRLIAVVNFERQSVLIDQVFTSMRIMIGRYYDANLRGIAFGNAPRADHRRRAVQFPP